MKSLLHFAGLIIILFSLHFWVVLPAFSIKETVPVIFQHLLLGGFSIIIYLVAYYIGQFFYEIVGFVVLGFLVLKMIFLGAFINAYKPEMADQPILKYIILILYFIYLIFLLVKIVPLININQPSKKE